MTPRHKLLNGMIVAVAVCCFNQIGFSQTYYSNPPVYQAPSVYHQPAPVWHNNSPCQPRHQSCNCGCGGTTGCVENPGDCKLIITPGTICSTKTTQPIPVKPPCDCDCEKVTKKFYDGEQKRNGWTEVPTKIIECEEKYRFERKTFSVCGCKVTVCIPCAIDYINSEKCEPRSKEVEMVARIRASSLGPKRADIWVYNVKGLPDKAVLALNVTASEANNRFNASFNY